MFPVKVKVEKSEMEMAKARNQLDAVLQCLLEKSHMDRLEPGPAWGTTGWELFGLTLIVGGGMWMGGWRGCLG